MTQTVAILRRSQVIARELLQENGVLAFVTLIAISGMTLRSLNKKLGIPFEDVVDEFAKCVKRSPDNDIMGGGQ